MKFFLFISISLTALHLTSKSQNTFPTTAGAYAAIGSTSQNTTALYVRKDITTLNTANFITIDNRGSNAQYTTSHITGGILFAGYRDVRAPANIAGIWAIRSSQTNGLNSAGDLAFGTTAVPLNISSDNTLPDERMRITYDGKIGMGTNAPTQPLSVIGTVQFNAISDQTSSYTRISWNTIIGTGASTFDNHRGLGTTAFVFRTTTGTNPFTELMRIDGNGNVLINMTTQTNTTYKLDVGGAARANKVVVNTTGADFVFDSSYDLKPLAEVEKYIGENKHLPDIASAADMQREGLDLGGNQTKLLQKIEELTLYIIELNKKIVALETKNTSKGKK